MAWTKLGTGDFGADVTRVHDALAQRGITVSQEERLRKFFGPSTREAVLKFQTRQAMIATGEVDADTASRLSLTAPPFAQEGRRGRVPGAAQDQIAQRDPTARPRDAAMRAITPGLAVEQRGVEVADLQLALFKLDFADTITQQEWTDLLFGTGTAEAVRRLQFQFAVRAERPGEVDQPTADFINARLLEMKVFHQVAGRLTNQQGSAVAGNLLFAFDRDNIGGAYLGFVNTNADGAYAIIYDPTLYARPAEGVLKLKDIIDLVVQVYDAAGATLAESAPLRQPGQRVQVDLRLNDLPMDNPINVKVEGRVSCRSRAGVSGLRVDIVDKNIGGDVFLAQASTNDIGAYAVDFTILQLKNRCKRRPDLQARVFIGDTHLGSSEVHYNASDHETMNVFLADAKATSLPAEHESLTGALNAHCGVNLRDLKEEGERQDITYLANKTGWDARAVALAALADQFSARATDAASGTTIEPALFYALFRAGLPANDDALYQTGAESAETIWKNAIEQGVIPSALEKSIPQARERFRDIAMQRALDAPAAAGLSTLKEMLSVSLGDDPALQQQFAALHTEHRASPDKLWAAVQETLGEPATQRLQLDGKLSYLTLNNASLVRALHANAGPAGMTQALDLVDRGFHRAESWMGIIGDGAIPPEISGNDDGEKRANYAELMAAQVRLSFPTAVVAREIEAIASPVANFGGAGTFLREHHGKFEIGMQAIEQYISRNNLQVTAEVTQAILQVQRVYKITPSDGAMTGLLKRGIDSAYAVTQYGREDFIRLFKDDVGGEAAAGITHANAQRVHNAVLNLATSYLVAKSSPPIGVHSPAQIVAPAPSAPANVSDVIAYPTLERLFGEMDYCACEHCRSILSPAAYLVSLLQFIDLKRFDNQGNELPRNFVQDNPLDVLLDRRPDIAHLPLTCENTNTALPYIDLVNETLEYFVFKKLSLEKYQGHDTDVTATQEELSASPQFGETEASIEAYKTLAAANFPQPLPFNQELENLRRYANRFEVPLPEMMAALRESDDIERASDAAYGWRDIRMEELCLSRAEYELLTNRKLNLQEIYGFPQAMPEGEVLSNLSNAKAFARRLDISYEDIIALLKTRFVNPASTLVPKLARLHVPFSTLKQLKDGTLTDADFDKLLPQGLDTSQYGGDIKAWVKDEENYANFMGLITLTVPLIPWAATATVGQGDCVVPTLPATGSALCYECTTAGISAATEPSPWPDAPGKTVTDGTVIWTCRSGTGGCSFDRLRLRYADPYKIDQPIRPLEFFRLLRFIRLWKKLGWSIEQTDTAITALYPADQLPNVADGAENLERLDAGMLVMLPRLGPPVSNCCETTSSV